MNEEKNSKEMGRDETVEVKLESEVPESKAMAPAKNQRYDKLQIVLVLVFLENIASHILFLAPILAEMYLIVNTLVTQIGLSLITASLIIGLCFLTRKTVSIDVSDNHSRPFGRKEQSMYQSSLTKKGTKGMPRTHHILRTMQQACIRILKALFSL